MRQRHYCYRCHKPQITCICRYVRRVHNRTPVWIVQHPRERFHPIGTARILALGLEQVHVSVCHQPLKWPPPQLPEGAALLYPGRDDETLPSLAPLAAEQAPGALVVIDGTWSHARTLYRQNEWLQALPRYRLSPRAPSRYRIRREPAAHCVSTVEAVVEALSLLEPDNVAPEVLLEAFEAMIDEQLRLLRERRTDKRRPQRKRRRRPAIPALLTEAPERLVLVYAESRADCRDPSRPRQLVQWCALRPAGGAVFDRVLRIDVRSLVPQHLEHMRLSPDELRQGVTLAELRAAWGAFCRPGDVLLSWDRCSQQLLADVMAMPAEYVLLKTAYCNWRRRRSGTLEDVLAREQLQPLPVAVRGRARDRLGNAAALLAHLQAAAAPLSSTPNG